MTTDQQVPRRRHIRVWLALSALLILLGLVFLPPFVSIARYKSRITGLVSAALHRPVRLSSVELRILPRPGFVITDLTVDEDPAYGAEPVLHANTVTAAIRLASLWRGQVQLSRISVDEASLNLVHSAAGKWNLDPLFRTAASLSGPTRETGRSSAYPYMEATNSRINIKNGAEKLPYSLVSADASLWQDEGVWHVRLKAQPARTDVVLDLGDTGIVRAEGTLHSAPDLDQMPLHVDLQWNDAQVGQLSRLLLGSDEGWRGDLRGEFHLDGTPAAAQVKSRLRATGIHRAEFAPVAPLDFDASCSFGFRSTDRAVEGLLCESPIGEGRARLTGDVPGAGHPPRLSLELNRVPAQAGLDALRTLRTHVAPGLQAEGAVSGKMVYDPAKVTQQPPTPSRRIRGRRPAGPPRPPPGPLSGGFTLEGLRLSGDTLTTPLQVARISIDPALAVPGMPPAVTTTVALPAGGPGPLSFTARMSLHRFQLGVRGSASLARLRELVHVAGIPQAESLNQIAGDPATLDLAAEGPWLPVISNLPLGPDAPPALVPAGTPADEGTMTGAIAFRNAIWRPSYLALPVQLRAATLRFANGQLHWDPVSFSYGPVEGTAAMELPPLCAPSDPCVPHLSLRFEDLDAAAVQSAILGARQPGTLLSTLIAKLAPATAPNWPVADCTVQSRTLVLGPFTFGQVLGSVEVRHAGVQITSFDAAVLGGTLHATAVVTPGTKPTYAVMGSFAKLDPAQVFELMALKATGGLIDGAGSLQLSGYTEDDLTASANGDLHFVWSQGGLMSSTDESLPVSLSHFDQFNGKATIADGVLKLTTAEIRRGARRSTVDAQVSFGIPARLTFGQPKSAAPKTQ
ncbi:AsmA family protein [Acidobacteria bacterium AB60]|nr:AsmA family protein [Acidobacteria bacterium AB60]